MKRPHPAGLPAATAAVALIGVLALAAIPACKGADPSSAPRDAAVGEARRAPDLDAERAELLRLHGLERETHIEKDAARLVEMFSDDFRNVAGGDVTQPSARESRGRLQAYFDRSTFLAWDDVEPPVVRISRDGSMAYVIVRKLVHVQAPDSTGEPAEERTVFAWTETWEKRNGEWKLTSVTSTDDRAPR